MTYFGFSGLFFLIVFAIAIIPAIFYLLTLQNALYAVSPGNRRMPPGNVWLLFIPVFNIIYIFIVVEAIGSSFKLEYEKFGVFPGDKPTYNLGLAMAIVQICSIFIPFGGIVSFVLWIAHWVKVNENKNEIINLRNNSRLGDNEPSIFTDNG